MKNVDRSSPVGRQARGRTQLGMTLIELMVALVISLVILLAAVASLTVARRGFSTVDAASQLRDTGRFATDVIQRIGVQTGYRDAVFAASPCLKTALTADCPPAIDAAALISPNVLGVDNAVPSSSDPVNDSTPRSSGSLGYGSDILVLRYQMSRLYPDIGTNPIDGSMIDCAGGQGPNPKGAIDRNDRLFSVLYVGTANDGEPALMCYRQTTGLPKSLPLVNGVEDFQVLYGVSGVTPNVAPPASAAADPVPERYLRATEMVVPGNTVATAANWRRVRSLRIGMVLRGPANSAQSQSSDALYPFGTAKGSSSGSAGSAFASAADVGTIFTPPNDGRLRQVVTFTVHLRNFQEP